MKKIKVFLTIALVFTIMSIGSNSNASNFGQPEPVSATKIWTISFNDFIDFNSHTKELILVKDNENKVVETKITLGDDKKSILVSPPEKGYNPGKMYSLYINQNLKSKEGYTLDKSISMDFTIEEMNIYNFTGKENLSRDGYLNIIKGSIELNQDQVIINMYLRDIPESILFNKSSVPDDTLEYEWGINIGTASNKGYGLSASKFKFQGAQSESLPIERAVQTDVWKLKSHPSSSSGATRIDKAQIYINYNLNLITITGEIPGISSETVNYIEVLTKGYGISKELIRVY